MSGDWSLRLARPEDADAMPAIEQAAATLFEDLDNIGTLDPDDVWQADDLRRCIRKGHSLVTHVGGEMAGFLVTEPFGRELHLWEMDVHPRFQKRGIGAGLVRACMVDARNSGFRALTLTTFRNVAWNAPFYARLGFEMVKTPVEHQRLADVLNHERELGLPSDQRCAMILFLD